MLHLIKKLFEAGLTVFSVSGLHHAVVLLLLTHHCGGQSLVVGPSQPVIVNVGDDVMLPCHLEPAVDAINMTVEWARPDLKPRFVHVWHERKDHQINQHQSYKGRTSVSIESLKHGDISLKLSKVKLSDNGTYRCYIPDLTINSTVEIVVGQPLLVGPSQPVIVNVGDDVILPCHLEPAVDAINMTVEWARPELNPRFVHVWHGRKDHQINQHQSYKGRTSVSIESLKHGDISLKLSKVKLSDNGKYRCYIPGLNKDSTVELVVGADSEIDPYSVTFVGENQEKAYSLGVTVALIVFACYCYCYRKKPAEVKIELENQKEQLEMQLEMIEREKEENKILLESLEEKWNKTVDKQQLMREKDNLSDTRWKLDEKMKDTQKVLIETEKLLQILNAAAQRMSAQRRDDLPAMMEQKKELENQKEQLKMRLEMIEREKEENKTLLKSLEEKRNKTDDKQQLIKEKENLNETRRKIDEKRKDTQKNSTMLHLMKKLFEAGLTVFSVSVLHHAVVLLLLTHHCGGQPLVVGPSQPVIVNVGDDVILPCHLEPAVDAIDMTVEWARPELNPRFVHVWHGRKDHQFNQHQSYKGRTSVSIESLKHGDISLKLSKVKLSDNGKYRCYIPGLNKDSTVELVVGAASSLVISLAGIDTSSSRVVLQCESKGWYPEPEVFWLDGERKLLSAGPTETVRGPDDLYTVISRVTVEKKHSNNFTCRVQQNHINQTRETHIIVPDDFFVVPCRSAAHFTIILFVCIMCVFAVVFVVWKWRQNKTNTDQIEKKHLMAESERREDEMVAALMEQKKELKDQMDQLELQEKKMDELLEEKKKQLVLVEKEIEKEDKSFTNAPGYIKLKEIIIQYEWNVTERKNAFNTLVLNTEKLVEKTQGVINGVKGSREAQGEKIN
ncbi:hypothetical protein PAMA_013614 [Pampus argenteus]